MAKKLIIIDDSATQLNVLKTLFANEGWEVCGVQSAKIGHEMIFDFAPDLIISDAIMPLMGGFQLLKLIRENEKISKIPIIIYSVLNESNAKFYIHEEYSEYFLRKDNNQDKLLEMANRIVEKFPLPKEYKDEILRIGIENYKSIKTLEEGINELEDANEEVEIPNNLPQNNIDLETIKNTLKANNNFLYGDEKNFAQVLNELYETLKYDLAVLNVYSFENEQNKVFFDIKDIILSPILRNAILNKYETSLNFMYKKYAPNLDTIMQEGEFLSKIEFDFEYKENNIASITFYSREKAKWENFEQQDELKDLLYRYFKARYLAKSSQTLKQDDIINKYFSFNKFKDIKNELDTYFGTIQIINFSELNSSLAPDELDIINSKISEKIIECIEADEQIYKNDIDEYNIVIFAKDLKHAKYRLEYILKEIELISFNTYKVESSIVAINCNIDGNFSLIEAQKKVKDFIEEAQEQEKVVIL